MALGVLQQVEVHLDSSLLEDQLQEVLVLEVSRGTTPQEILELEELLLVVLQEALALEAQAVLHEVAEVLEVLVGLLQEVAEV